MSSKILLFTDLDGTLLDKYTYEVIAPDMVEDLLSMEVEIIPCSSKTRAEQEDYRRVLGIETPFIVENGSAILIERGYFPSELEDNFSSLAGYRAVILGERYEVIDGVLREYEKEKGELRRFGRMSVEEVAEETGLSLDMAAKAKMREFSETIVCDENTARDLRSFLESRGLRLIKGTRYHSAMGDTDKGRAARILIDLYRRAFGDVVSFAVGDGENDIPMLEAVDYPIAVTKDLAERVREAHYLENISDLSRYIREILNL